MKNLLIIFLFLIGSHALHAQVIAVSVSGLMDYEVIDSIFFDDDSMLDIDTIDGGIWQIGTPEKPVFAQSWSASKALITDSAHSYPININESVVFKFPSHFFDNYLNPAFAFNHRLDLSEGDTAFIEVSTDSIHWFSPLNFSSTLKNPIFVEIFSGANSSPFLEPYNFNYFTNQTSDWMQTSIWLSYFIPVKVELDTALYFRFRFKSDNTLENKDGWMIDNLYLINYSMWGSTGENGSLNAKLFPNPNNDNTLFIQCENAISKVQWYSLQGSMLAECMIKSNRIEIPDDLVNGLYWVKIINESGNSAFQQIIIQK